jgi:hypothetical protein
MTDAMNITIHIATIYNGECQIIKSTKTISVTAVLIELNTLSLFIVVYYCFGSIIRIIDFHLLSHQTPALFAIAKRVKREILLRNFILRFTESSIFQIVD